MITVSKSTQPPLSSATSTAPAGAPAVTPAPAITPAVTPKPGAAVARQGESPALWVAYGLACVFLTVLALHLPASRAALSSPLFALLSGLSLLAVLLPASGPRGQRVGLLPGVGLAAVLLLPTPAAAVPLLVANVLYAASRQTSLARRAVLGRGVWLVLASLAAGGIYGWLSGGAAGFRPAAAILASGLYFVLYTAGRQVGLRRKEGQGRQAYRRARVSWRMEAVALLASVPPALLMTLAEPQLGTAGVAAAAALMALLLLIAHFGFEVALLREQVRAMEKISAVTLSQINPSRLIERFLHLSGGLIPYDRASLWLTDHSQTRLERVARRHPMAAPAAEPSLARDPAEAGQEATDAAVRFGEGLVGRVADRQQPLIVRDGARDPRSLDVETTDRHAIPFSLLLLPLVVSGETVGVVQFEREAPGSYTNRDLSRVRALAS